jgi:hypothetical protein
VKCWAKEVRRKLPLQKRRYSVGLQRDLSARNLDRAREHPHEVTCGELPSVIYSHDDGVHGNFLSAAYRRILAKEDWNRRLQKAYTASRSVPRQMDRRRSELDCATSSDALLMNIFCYPGVLARRSVCSVLGIDRGVKAEFGFHPRTPLQAGHVDRTEIDLKLGDLLIEAKLTEGDFQSARPELLHRYRDFDAVFEADLLPSSNGVLRSYQLLRGVLAAEALNMSFCVLCDQRRPDLIEDWYQIVSSVRIADLRCRLKVLTWQELAVCLCRTQQIFLETKYGIVSCSGVNNPS